MFIQCNVALLKSKETVSLMLLIIKNQFSELLVLRQYE